MRTGENGEVVLENYLDAHYVRMGALATRNSELFSAVNAARKERDHSTGEATLSSNHTQGVHNALDKLSDGFMYGLVSTITFTYPQYAAALKEVLENTTPVKK